MGRTPCCEKVGLNRGTWSSEEDQILIKFIQFNGHSNWRELPKKAGLLRCGKSCRLRWTNYLRPGLKRGDFTHEEEETIIKLHELLGNRWSAMASKLPGRTDNEIKNVWNGRLKRRLTSNQISKHQDQLKKNIRFHNQLPCLTIKSDGEKNDIDHCTKNNNDKNDIKFEELAFSEDFLKNLLSEEEFFEKDWNLEKDFEMIKGNQSPQEFDIPLSGKKISCCSSSDTDDIMDFWWRVFMNDGKLPELQEKLI